MNSSERRLMLMLLIQQGGKRKTVDELAEHFGVSRRTIFRDFNALQKINVPITWDKYSGYGVIPGYKIPPLMFSTQELATIIVGLNFVKSQVDKQMVDDAKGVEVKIQNVLPGELKEFMSSLQENTIVDPYGKFGSEKKKGGNWYLISSSVSQKRRIEFKYSSASGEKKIRKIDPYILVFYEDHWNVIGFSHLRGEIRNFILDKMDAVKILDEKFSKNEKITIEGLIFRFNESSQKVEVLVDEGDFERFEANLPAKIISKKEIKSKKIKASFLFDNLGFINQWLLQFGSSIKILSPHDLIERRNELLKKMLES